MSNFQPGIQALIVHGRISSLTGRTCTLNNRFPSVSYDYAKSMGVFSAWDVTFDGAPVIDDDGRRCRGGMVPEIYLVPLPDDDTRERTKNEDMIASLERRSS